MLLDQVATSPSKEAFRYLEGERWVSLTWSETKDKVFQLAAGAAEQDKFTRPESHVSRRPAILDEQGFSDASKVLSEARDRISEIEGESRRRLEDDGAEPVPAVAVALLFDAPDVPDED